MGSVNAIIQQIRQDVDNVEKKILKADSVAKMAMIKEAKKDIDKRVPYKTGTLARSQAVKANPFEITYASCSYAPYAFNPVSKTGTPKQYNTSTHPQAQGNPIEVSIAEDGEKWKKVYRDKFREEMRR